RRLLEILEVGDVDLQRPRTGPGSNELRLQRPKPRLLLRSFHRQPIRAVESHRIVRVLPESGGAGARHFRAAHHRVCPEYMASLEKWRMGERDHLWREQVRAH